MWGCASREEQNHEIAAGCRAEVEKSRAGGELF